MGIWEFKKNLALLTVSSLVVLGVFIAYTLEAEAEPPHKRVTLRDLGVAQLAAHDFFNVNRCLDLNRLPILDCDVVDHETGKLELSTLFKDTITGKKFTDEEIAIGGETRNRENIMLFTVASEYGERYLDLKEEMSAKKAQKQVINEFNEEIKEVYERMLDEPYPDKIKGKTEATATENLALRILHVLLPGKIMVDGKMVSTLDPDLRGIKLTDEELEQLSKKLDGKFDQAFLNIVICFFNPPMCLDPISLLEADQSFGDQFDTEFTFDHFLEEVKDGSFDSDEDVTEQIRNLFAKGQVT